MSLSSQHRSEKSYLKSYLPEHCVKLHVSQYNTRSQDVRFELCVNSRDWACLFVRNLIPSKPTRNQIFFIVFKILKFLIGSLGVKVALAIRHCVEIQI